MSRSPRSYLITSLLIVTGLSLVAADDLGDLPQPPLIDPGAASTEDKAGAAPSDAVVLFDGTNLDAWQEPKWTVKDGIMEVKPKSGTLTTKEKFGDCQLHIEWRIPDSVKGDGQHRGNSGVYLMGLYEVQVLETMKNKTYADGMAAAIYKQSAPLVNAGRGVDKWQSYDIIFHRPHFKTDGALESPATITVLHNGVLVQDHFTLTGPTTHLAPLPYKQHDDALPLSLQDHGDKVQFRNIWIRRLEK